MSNIKHYLFNKRYCNDHVTKYCIIVLFQLHLYKNINHLKYTDLENLLGTGYIIEIDTVTALTASRGTEANYIPVSCLTSNGFTGSTAAQSTANKCDGGFETSLPGMSSWGMSGEGVATSLLESEEATRANFQSIALLWKEKKTFWARWSDALGNFVREGKVWISAYDETAPNNEAYTFTATFTGTGEPLLEPATP